MPSRRDQAKYKYRNIQVIIFIRITKGVNNSM